MSWSTWQSGVDPVLIWSGWGGDGGVAPQGELEQVGGGGGGGGTPG